MSKLRALKLLRWIKLTRAPCVQYGGELFTAEELMERIQGREVTYEEALNFLTK